jgi:hypothetical protein
MPRTSKEMFGALGYFAKLPSKCCLPFLCNGVKDEPENCRALLKGRLSRLCLQVIEYELVNSAVLGCPRDVDGSLYLQRS